MTKSSKDLTISIVSYNTKDLLRRCLTSIYKHTKTNSFEVIVIDNNSSDDSAQMVKKEFPKVKLIQNKKNNYYTKANNQALKIARGKYFLILNSDIYLKSNTLKTLVNYLNTHPQVGSVEPLQVDEQGTPLPTGTKHSHPLADLINLTLLHKFFKNIPFIKKITQSQLDRSKTWETDVVCDAVMMIPTQLLRQLNGYDPKMLLYYTENDLCLRLQQQGFKNIHLGTAKVWHTVSASTDQLGWKKVNHYYAIDAQAYYAKHFHPLLGTFIKLSFLANNVLIDFYKFLKQNPLVVCIVLLAAFLRFYQLDKYMSFIGDHGRDFLVARDMIQTGHIPLLGIPSSVPRFHQGPIYIWLLAPVLFLGNFDPYIAALFAASLGLFAVGATYILANQTLNKHTALISALIIATSTLAIVESRAAFHTNAIPLTSAIFIYTLYKFHQQKLSSFWPSLSWAMLFQLELVAAPLFALIPLIFFLNKLKPKFTHIKKVLFALVIGLFPLIIYDLTHQFKQLGLFIVWIGYRITSFAGLSPEHTTSLSKLTHVATAIFSYLQRFFSWYSPLPTLFIIISTTLILLFNRTKLSQFINLTIAYVLIMFISFAILGNASQAYFPILFIPLAILPAHAISLLKTPLKHLAMASFAILTLFNSYYIISHNFLLTTPKAVQNNPFGTYGAPLTNQIELTSYLANLGTPLHLISTDPGSQHQSFLDNYRYLILIQEGQLDPQGAPVWIYQSTNSSRPPNSYNLTSGSVTVSIPLELIQNE